MAATETLKVVIDSVFQGKGVSDAAKGLKEVDDGAKSSGVSLGALVGKVGAVVTALGAIYVAGKQAWEVMGNAAAMSRAADQYDRLAESIGTAGDVLLAKMEEATNGMMARADLMASASEIIRLGLATDEEQVVRLATVISKLGWDMQTVIMTFANDSKMRLDALGLSVTDVEDRMKKFTDAGMDAGAAFDLAVIEAGEEQIRLVGDAADYAEGGMRRWEAAIKDVQDRLKMGFGGFLDDSYIAGQQIERALELGLISGEQLLEAQTGLGGFMETVVSRKLGVAELITEFDRLTQAAISADKAMLGHAAPVTPEAPNEGRRGFGWQAGRTAEARRIQRLSASSGWSMQPMIDWQAQQAELEAGAARAAQAAAESFASTFQASLQSEGGLNIGEMLLGEGVERGFDLTQLTLLGEGAGIVGDKLREAAVDALVWQEAMRLMGEVEGGRRSIESMQLALENFRKELENWDLTVPERAAETASSRMVDAMRAMEGVVTDDTTTRIVGMRDDLGTISDTLANITGTQTVTVETNAADVQSQEIQPLIADLDNLAGGRIIPLTIDLSYSANSEGWIIEVLDNYFSRQGATP